MSIAGIALISIPVSNQEASKEFYLNVLGFELVRDDASVPGIRWITVRPRGGSVNFSLVTWFESMPAGSLRGVVLTSDDIHATHAELSTRGVSFESPPEVRAWGVETVFHDPDGNHFALQQS